MPDLMNKTAKILQIIQLLKKEFPGPEPKPGKGDPLDVLIATMLSQNTTDKTSYKAFTNLKTQIGNWEDVLNAPLRKIKKAIRVCGLANQKSVSIKKLLKTLIKERGNLSLNYIKKLGNSEIYEDLLSYNGVGIKTISCVIAFGLGRDVFPVDTHVHRLSNRLGLANTKTPDKTFEQMNNIVPDGKKFLLHTLLIKFGRKVCRAKNPYCGKCVLFDVCSFTDKERYFSSQQQNSLSFGEGRGGVPRENNFIILEHVGSAGVPVGKV